MAKVYLREGVRRGKVGNEVYVYSKGVNFVKASTVYMKDALTDPQMLARARYCNTVKMYKLLKNSLSDNFEINKNVTNGKNKFYSLNLGICPPVSRDFFMNPIMPPVGNFISSYGSLGSLDIGTTTQYPFLLSKQDNNPAPLLEEQEIPLDDFQSILSNQSKNINNPSPILFTFQGVIIPRINISSQNPTIGTVSSNLILRYPWIHEGDTFKMFGFLYSGLQNNTGEDKFVNPIVETSSVGYRHVYVYNCEFTIDKSDSVSLNDKGLLTFGYDTTTTATTAIIAFKEDSGYSYQNVSMVNMVNSPMDIGYFGAVIIRKTSTLTLSSSGFLTPNSCANSVISLMNDEDYKQTIISLWKEHYKRRSKLKR